MNVKFRRCKKCRIETPQERNGWSLLGTKWRCRVCGTLWVHDELAGDQEVKEARHE